MIEFSLKPRDLYLDKIVAGKDNGRVKMLTGMRRTGKTCLMKLMEKHLLEHGASREQVIRINFERIDTPRYTAEELLVQLKKMIGAQEYVYLLLDEVQRIVGWEEVLNKILAQYKVDLYIGGSNAGILSSNFEATAKGEVDRILVLPFSLPEFIEFHEFTRLPQEDDKVNANTLYLGKNGKGYTLEEIFELYIKYGGLPIFIGESLDVDTAMVAIDGVFSNIVMRDILEFEKRKDRRVITDPLLLRDVLDVMGTHLGTHISATSVCGVLSNAETPGRSPKPATRTIETYMQALTDSNLFCEAIRYDIRTDKFLKTLQKYYIVDDGLFHYMIGNRKPDRESVLENRIFFELMRRQYDTVNGKIDREEINFISKTPHGRIYIQTCIDPDTERGRKQLKNLRKVRDSYPKYLVVLRGENKTLRDGVIQINALDFLMGRDLFR